MAPTAKQPCELNEVHQGAGQNKKQSKHNAADRRWQHVCWHSERAGGCPFETLCPLRTFFRRHLTSFIGHAGCKPNPSICPGIKMTTQKYQNDNSERRNFWKTTHGGYSHCHLPLSHKGNLEPCNLENGKLVWMILTALPGPRLQGEQLPLRFFVKPNKLLPDGTVSWLTSKDLWKKTSHTQRQW